MAAGAATTVSWPTSWSTTSDLGFTHVELLPVTEHPFDGSWGYQVSAYFAPTSRFGTPDDFRYLVDTLHQAGIGVIVDWVPAHFPKDDWALRRFDGTALYEHDDPRAASTPTGARYIFNFGRNEVRNFLVANALYWLEEFHIDGLRVDAVASMLYLDYSRKAGRVVPEHLRRPREPRGRRVPAGGQRDRATAAARRHDDRRGVDGLAGRDAPDPRRRSRLRLQVEHGLDARHAAATSRHDPIHRQYHHHQMTFAMLYAYSENFVLPISHDEVVHGKGSLLRKMPGDRWQQLANLRAFLAYMWAHPGKKLLFMGTEFAQESEWSESRSSTGGCSSTRAPRRPPAGQGPQPGLHATPPRCGRSTTIRRASAGSTPMTARQRVRFLRSGSDRRRRLACITNFSSVSRHDYRVGLPAGRWDEIINTDAELYSGSGVGNLGAVDAVDEGWHGRPSSAVVQVPPLATVWLRQR